MGDFSSFGAFIAQVMIAGTAFVFLLMLAVVLLVAHGVRKVARSPRVKQANLKVKAQCTFPGPRRELAQLRLGLNRAVTSAQTAVEFVRTHRLPSGEIASLVRRLERAAGSLDAQLRIMECEPDDRYLREMLVPARARVNEISDIVRSIQQVVVTSFDTEVSHKMGGLAQDVNDEVQAIRAGIEALHQLNAGNPYGSEFDWGLAGSRQYEPARKTRY